MLALHQHAEIRRRLRQLVLPDQRRVHFVKESDRRRRFILAEIRQFPVVVSTRSCRICPSLDEQAARTRCLLALVEGPPGGVVIESRGPALDAMDRRALQQRAGLPIGRYDHVSPYDEPLLWIPDAIVWANGKGKAWRPHLLDEWGEDDDDVTP